MTLQAIPSTDTDQHGRGYPRPQFRRETWVSLNGTWDFAIDADGVWREPGEVRWSSQITLPFAPETAASGVGHTGFFRACWYRRRCPLPPRQHGQRWMLHFGAVDRCATVWVNGRYVGTHEG